MFSCRYRRARRAMFSAAFVRQQRAELAVATGQLLLGPHDGANVLVGRGRFVAELSRVAAGGTGVSPVLIEGVDGAAPSTLLTAHFRCGSRAKQGLSQVHGPSKVSGAGGLRSVTVVVDPGTGDTSVPPATRRTSHESIASAARGCRGVVAVTLVAARYLTWGLKSPLHFYGSSSTFQ